MNTCRRNAGGNKRGPELEDGRSERLQGSREKEGDYPRFFDQGPRIQVNLLHVLYCTI